MDKAVSKATTTNPKDLLGAKKVALSAVSPVAIAHEACAMMDGEWKYGFRNWRDKSVIARIYIDAALRHIMAWFEGEEVASDSGVHHLGHARACLGIILDAQATGNLIDNRTAGQYVQISSELSEWVIKRQEHHAAVQTNKISKKPRRRKKRSRAMGFAEAVHNPQHHGTLAATAV